MVRRHETRHVHAPGRRSSPLVTNLCEITGKGERANGGDRYTKSADPAIPRICVLSLLPTTRLQSNFCYLHENWLLSAYGTLRNNTLRLYEEQ